MMNVDLICVGKLNAAYCAEGVAEYQKRLGAYCRFRIVELPEETIRESWPAGSRSRGSAAVATWPL